jgi:murein DD-endopeptidase MepM/ murein hydrolase activator NlpD
MTEPSEHSHGPNQVRKPAYGLRALAVVGVLFAGSIAGGFWMAQTGVSPIGSTAEAATPLPLAVRLNTATDLFPLPVVVRTEGQLKRNETLTELVQRLGAEPGEAAAALANVYGEDLLDPRRLRPGIEVETFIQNGALCGITIRAAAGESLLIERTADTGQWTARALKAKLTTQTRRVATVIETSIYEAARALGAGDQHVVDFASAFAYDVDFQREIYPGDKFEILFEAQYDERGNYVAGGDVLYAALDGKALTRGFYRFMPGDDQVPDYYDTQGESATKFLMKTPINGARISSSFGKRRHPISGYTKLHKGTDFAAPAGTPVYAAGSGTVEKASRYGGYGNYVRLAHANGYKTAYAHLSRYAKGMKPGKRLKQGDVIGYVGSTGASTGPHLHYEVYVKGKPVNVMSLNLPNGRKLKDVPEVFAAFEAHKAAIDGLRLANGASADASVSAVALNKAP